MTTAQALIQDAQLYPQKIAFEPQALLLVTMDQARYRAASFLDDRMLDSVEKIGWVPLAPIETVAQAIAPLPLSFIFHAGHVGSTLLSRLLDEVPGVLGLREPVPLRQLAAPDVSRHDLARWLKVLLPLWGRGFAGIDRIILKATSSAGQLAPDLMAALPDSRAVYLNLQPEPYLAVLLAGEATRSDLENMTHERLARLRAQLGEALDDDRALTVGEGAAAAWVAERLAQARAEKAAGARLLALDFDAMLADMEGTLENVLTHLALPPLAATLAQSPALARYSKLSGDHAYSADLRRRSMDQARAEQGGEIALGLALIERLAARHASVAALL